LFNNARIRHFLRPAMLPMALGRALVTGKNKNVDFRNFHAVLVHKFVPICKGKTDCWIDGFDNRLAMTYRK
jgi:hypothetical protein